MSTQLTSLCRNLPHFGSSLGNQMCVREGDGHPGIGTGEAVAGAGDVWGAVGDVLFFKQLY